MAFSDLLCHMARSPALAFTVLLTLAGLVVVLSILVKQISVLFVTIKSLFAL